MLKTTANIHNFNVFHDCCFQQTMGLSSVKMRTNRKGFDASAVRDCENSETETCWTCAEAKREETKKQSHQLGVTEGQETDLRRPGG